jgi:hypothetical protein
MWTSGFFNSVNGDRLYNAQQMSELFEGLITDGVYLSVANRMAVEPNSGMTIQIATGRGWFNKHWVNNDSVYTLTLENSDVTLNRYVAVCIRVDDTDAVRDAVPYLKYSEYATTPVKPTMERSEKVKEYCLAYVYIGAGVTTITAGNIEDTRADESVCGWVSGLIEQLSTATLFTQFTDIFNTWFNGLKDLINANTETMLVNALPVSLTVELSADKWVDGSQTVTVSGMNTTKSVIIQGNAETLEAYNDAVIKCTAQGVDSLTFTAETVPADSVKVDVLHMGV